MKASPCRCATVLFLFAVFFSFGCSSQTNEALRRAEELSRQGQIDDAISSYREHMENRLRVQARPEWENPYFYLIIIGDLELGRGNVDSAISAYTEAQRAGVHASLISDRFRSVGQWYQERGQLEKAFEHLKKYRDLDTLLFDAMLDRLARDIVRKEEGDPLDNHLPGE